MGEAAADTRREIEQTRRRLDATVGELRGRGEQLRARARRLAPRVAAVAGSVVVVAAGVTVTVVVLRRRRGGPLTQAARRKLPQPTRGVAVPAARGAERWAQQRAERMRRRQDEYIDLLADRIAERQGKAEPMWRRTTLKALESGVGVAVPVLVRRAIAQGTGGRAGTDTAEREWELRAQHAPASRTGAEVGVTR